jgi:predicted nucleic acid-binding protein
MTELPPPVFLDATVLSNFASSGSIDWLVTLLDRPAAVPTVRDEIERGREHGHRFLDDALDALGEGIPLLEVNGDTVPLEDHGIRRRLDAGEADSLIGALEYGGTLATDDLAARRLASECDVPVTGSIGLLVLGIECGTLDVDTANGWLATWRDERGYYAPVETVEEALPNGS